MDGETRGVDGVYVACSKNDVTNLAACRFVWTNLETNLGRTSNEQATALAELALTSDHSAKMSVQQATKSVCLRAETAPRCKLDTETAVGVSDQRRQKRGWGRDAG